MVLDSKVLGVVFLGGVWGFSLSFGFRGFGGCILIGFGFVDFGSCSLMWLGFGGFRGCSFVLGL